MKRKNDVDALFTEVKRLTLELRELEDRAQRDVLREAAQVCLDLDKEAMHKKNRLACGTECAAAIVDLAVRWNVPFFEEQR